MVSKREIRKLLKSGKLSGRESAALIIENEIAIRYGKKPTLTPEEKALIRFGLSERRQERLEYQGYLDTYQLAGYVIRDAHADALEVMWIIENVLDIVNKRIISRMNEHRRKEFPEILTHEEFAQKKSDQLEKLLLEFVDLEELLEEPLEIEGSSPELDQEAAQEILDLIKAGKLTVRQLDQEAEEELDQLDQEANQAYYQLADQGFSEIWHSELYDRVYEKSKQQEQDLLRALPEADQAAVIKILEAAAQGSREDQLAGLYCQVADLASQSERFKARYEHKASWQAEDNTVIVEPGAGLERLRKFEKRLNMIPVYAPLFDEIEDKGGLGLFVGSRIALIRNFLKRFYAAKIAIDELSMLLQVDIAPSLQDYEKRVLASIESYNRIAQAAPNLFDTFLGFELPVIDPEKLKPSEKKIQEYRDTLNKHFGNDWIQFSLEILEEDEPNFDRYKPFIQEA